MKVSKIGSLCKNKKTVATMSDPNGMWIGNGECAYLLPEFATLEQSGIALALGISEKERDKIRFFPIQMDQATFNTQDLDEAETPCLPIDFLFNVGVDTVRPYKTQECVLFLNTAHLAPLKEERENLTIFLRHLKNGKPYFAAKIGMELYRRIAESESETVFRTGARIRKQNYIHGEQAAIRDADDTRNDRTRYV